LLGANLEAEDVVSISDMTANNTASPYVLGNADTEHERLIWQAKRVGPTTERLFREAGIGAGQRVLDIGSGVGDVALLLARLVGPSGEVVGIERDEKSLARAKVRVEEAGLSNISFTRTDVAQIPHDEPFDAVVGRFILMFLPDPVATLRSLARLVRAGGAVAFQEPAWVPAMTLMAPLPLWSAVARILYETFLRSGAKPELGTALYQLFENAGLPGPIMRSEMPLGKHPDIAQWYADLFGTLRPEMQKFGLPFESVGTVETLRERLQAEVDASNSVVAFPAFVGAWAHKPAK
jgi:ubiquinone/menaquinone biosynthesis C-methylase UbiE